MFAPPMRPPSPPPPIPPQSLKRKGKMRPLAQRQQNAQPVKTFRYSTGYQLTLQAPPSTPVPARASSPDPFSDAFARTLHDRHTSDATRTTRNDSIFDRSSSTQSRNQSNPESLTSFETAPEPRRVSLLERLERLPNNNNIDQQVSILENVPNNRYSVDPYPDRGSYEPFPSFSNPFREDSEDLDDQPESVAEANNSPNKTQTLAQKLVGNLKRGLKKLGQLDHDFERWTLEKDKIRLQKKRKAEARRGSLARAKEIDHEHRAQIKAHKEKEKARNERSKKQLEEQRKEIKAQEKKRDEAAKNRDNLIKDEVRWKVRVYSRLRYGRPKTSKPAEREQVAPAPAPVENATTKRGEQSALTGVRSIVVDPYTRARTRVDSID